MAATIRIKRSPKVGGNATPTALEYGELAYSFVEVGGNKLYIGDDSGNIDVIGGSLYVSYLDHAPGTLTASSAILVNDSSKIDVINVDNITIDGNTISSTNTNGNIEFDPNGSGLVCVVSNVLSTAGDSSQLFKVVSSDDSSLFAVKRNGDVSIGGVLTVNGAGTSTFNGDVDINGSLTVQDSATFQGVISGDNLDITGNLTVDGNTVLGNSDTDSVTITGVFNADNLRIDGNTISSTNTNGDIILDPNGTGQAKIISSVLQTAGNSTDKIVRVVSSGDSDLLTVATNGDVTIGGVLTVNGSGTSTFNGDVDINGSLTVQDSATFNGVISGNNLDITGNLTVDGDTTLGNSDSDVTTIVGELDLTNATVIGGVTSSASLIPAADDTYDIGDSAIEWRNLYLDGTANIDNLQADSGKIGNITFSGTTISNDVGTSITIDPAPADSEGGDLIIRGNLTVQGTTTTVNSTEVTINDKVLVLADSSANATEADGGGISVDLGTDGNATLTYAATGDKWVMNKILDLPAGLASLLFGGVDATEVIEDHLATNVLVAGEAIDITYDDNANTITFAAELASSANFGVATFNDSDFTVTNGDVRLDTVDGGTF